MFPDGKDKLPGEKGTFVPKGHKKKKRSHGKGKANTLGISPAATKPDVPEPVAIESHADGYGFKESQDPL